jgi:hypothetical protein
VDTERKQIHVIGDSHALTFGGANHVTRHWLGPVTAAQLFTKHKAIMEEVAQTEPDEWLWFIVGEIDCRIHIYPKSLEYGLPIGYLIENTVSRYTSYIDYLQSTLFNPVSILAIIPQGDCANTWEVENYAPREIRQEVSTKYNQELQKVCSNRGIKFINLWPEEIPLEQYDPKKAHLDNKVVWGFVHKYYKENDVPL